MDKIVHNYVNVQAWKLLVIILLVNVNVLLDLKVFNVLRNARLALLV